MSDISPAGSTPPGGARPRNSCLTAILVGIAVLLTLLFLVRIGQGVYERLRPAPDLEIPATTVRVISMRPGVFEQTVPIAGSLAPVHSVDVFPKLGGKVVQMHVQLGDEVREGDPLATVESVEYGLQARQADVGYQMAEEAVEVAQDSFERLERVRESTDSLALSEQAYDEARIQVEGARTQRDVSKLQRDLARRMVDNATMRAPVSGLVSSVRATLGGMVGSEYPAFHVDDTSEFRVRCELGDLDLPLVKVGQPVRLWADALPERTLTGEVIAVSPTLDSWTRRAPVEIAVPNPAGDVTGNLFARGEIVVAIDEDALVLPLEVLRRTVDGAWVQLARGEIVEEVAVQVLAESHDQVSVSGLQPGDRVIVPGAEHLADGEPIRVIDDGAEQNGQALHVDQ